MEPNPHNSPPHTTAVSHIMRCPAASGELIDHLLSTISILYGNHCHYGFIQAVGIFEEYFAAIYLISLLVTAFYEKHPEQ